MNKKVARRKKEAMIKRHDLKKKMEEKLQEDGISKEWMDKHLIIDMGD